MQAFVLSLKDAGATEVRLGELVVRFAGAPASSPIPEGMTVEQYRELEAEMRRELADKAQFWSAP